MKNQEIAEIFNKIADILEIEEENPFRIRAYRKAAQNIEGLSKDIEDIVREKKLEEIPGIGKDLAQKIEEYVSKGKMKAYEDLKKGVSKGVLEFMEIPGVGPKTAKVLYKDLGIKNLKELQFKAKTGKIKHIFGIKEKTIENILRGIDFLKKSEGRTPLNVALNISEDIMGRLKKSKAVNRIEAAGSLRRRKETVRDIDIIATSNKPKEIMDIFVGLPYVKEVLAHGPTKSSVITKERIQVDLRVVEPGSFGSALAYLTGSKAHNIKLREMGVKKHFKINEYGVFSLKGAGAKGKAGRKIAGKEEDEIYRSLGLSYVPPEMREDRGEIELAKNDKIPKLLDIADIKADLHVHSEASDGTLSLEEIAEISKKKGYKYIVITEHSKTLKIAHGLSEKELFSEMKKIDKLNKRLRAFRILKGIEVDIMGDGTLDYKDNVLRELDFVIASVHSGFKQSKEALTGRILRAMENNFVRMIAHPTGRLMGVRDAYEIDMQKILKTARDTNTALEINAYPDRLDLNDINCKSAKEIGVMLGIGTDSHTKEQFDNMIYGVYVARRGWLGKKNILNALDLDDFLKRIKK